MAVPPRSTLPQSVLERAFDLAKSGRVTSMAELRRALKSEQYALTQISGPSLSRQLTALMREAAPVIPDASLTAEEKMT